jgi:hypothetical protein
MFLSRGARCRWGGSRLVCCKVARLGGEEGGRIWMSVNAWWVSKHGVEYLFLLFFRRTEVKVERGGKDKRDERSEQQNASK